MIRDVSKPKPMKKKDEPKFSGISKLEAMKLLSKRKDLVDQLEQRAKEEIIINIDILFLIDGFE